MLDTFQHKKIVGQILAHQIGDFGIQTTLCHSPCVSTFLLIADSKPTKLQRVQTAGQHHRRYVLLGLVPECTADKHRLAGDTIKGV